MANGMMVLHNRANDLDDELSIALTDFFRGGTIRSCTFVFVASDVGVY